MFLWIISCQYRSYRRNIKLTFKVVYISELSPFWNCITCSINKKGYVGSWTFILTTGPKVAIQAIDMQVQICTTSAESLLLHSVSLGQQQNVKLHALGNRSSKDERSRIKKLQSTLMPQYTCKSQFQKQLAN